MKSSFAWSFVALAAVLSVSGCAVDSGEPDERVDPVFTETKVILHGKDAPEVFVRKIKLSEQLKLARLRREQLVGGAVTDFAGQATTGLGTSSQAISSVSCSFGELEFWANADATGDTICFSGTGTATLGNFNHGSGGGNWSSRKKSFFTGPWNGRLQRPVDCSTYSYFSSSDFISPIVSRQAHGSSGGHFRQPHGATFRQGHGATPQVGGPVFARVMGPALARVMGPPSLT